MPPIRRLVPAVLAVAWALWLLFLGTDEAREVPGLGGDASGPVQHLVAFAVLGALVMLAVRRRPALVWAALVAVGAIGELVQQTTADREFEVVDIAMNALGAAVGIGLVVTIRHVAVEIAVPLVTIGLMIVAPLAPEAVRQIPLIYPEACGEAPPDSGAQPTVMLDASDLEANALPVELEDVSVAELRGRILATNQLTVETWFSTDDLTQSGPARVFTISDGPDESEVNVHIGVEGDDVSIRLRTSCNIFKWVQVPDVLSAGEPQHVVFTWRGAQLTAWVNGDEVSRINNRWGDFARWDPGYRVLVGDEVGGGRAFDGVVFQVTMWDAALDETEIVARSRLDPT